MAKQDSSVSGDESSTSHSLSTDTGGNSKASTVDQKSKGKDFKISQIPTKKKSQRTSNIQNSLLQPSTSKVESSSVTTDYRTTRSRSSITVITDFSSNLEEEEGEEDIKELYSTNKQPKTTTSRRVKNSSKSSLTRSKSTTTDSGEPTNSRNTRSKTQSISVVAQKKIKLSSEPVFGSAEQDKTIDVPSTSASTSKHDIREYPLRNRIRKSIDYHSSDTVKSDIVESPTVSSDSNSGSSSVPVLPRKRARLATTETLGASIATGGRETTNTTSNSVQLKSESSHRSLKLLSKRITRQKTTGSCASTSRKSLRGGNNFSSEGNSETARGTGMSGGSNNDSNNSGINSNTSTENSKIDASTNSSNTTNVNVSLRTNPFETFVASIDPDRNASTGASNVVDSESDDNDVGRLQALLEARGLPPHLIGALGPRMQQILQKSIGGNHTGSKAHQLLQGVQSTGDEGLQLQSVIEMCQMLVMGNEDTLSGFPVKQAVPALKTLLMMEHNYDMMVQAVRALTYMMEALPRSSIIVVDVIPVFLQRLQIIQCMDVAEQSLTALEMLSRRHGKSILQANGINACLMHIDFFSIVAQRSALAVTANCCINLSKEEFNLIEPSLSLLTNRLANDDKKSVENVCLAFSRLVENFKDEPNKLHLIAGNNLLKNLQQLLVVSPPIISTNSFITVLRMMSTMCSCCPDLAVNLLNYSIADTLCYLLTGSPDGTELISRSSQELHETVCLIGELMPKLPSQGLFAIDSVLEKPGTSTGSNFTDVIWQWKDDRSQWHSYTPVDSRIIEGSHQSGDEDVTITIQGHTYTIDFQISQQINDDTGTSRMVRRCPNLNNSSNTSENVTNATNSVENKHCQTDKFVESGLATSFIRSLFGILYEVYSSSAGPTVKYQCLRTLLRMIYYAPSELLQEVLKNKLISSHIACMLASLDLRIVVGALQMAEILMQKLPHVFEIDFTREGVIHEIEQLINTPSQSNSVPSTSNSPVQKPVSSTTISSPSTNLPNSYSQSSTHQPSINSIMHNNNTNVNDNSALIYSSTTETNIRIDDNANSSGDGAVNNASIIKDSDNSLDANSSNMLVMDDSSNQFVTKIKCNRLIQESSKFGGILVPKPSSDLSVLIDHPTFIVKEESNSRSSHAKSAKRSGKKQHSSSSSGRKKPSDSSRSVSAMNEMLARATNNSQPPNTSTGTSNSSSSRSKFSVAMKTSNFFASFNPTKWGKQHSDRPLQKDTGVLSKNVSNANISASNREKAKKWIRDRATIFMDSYNNKVAESATVGNNGHGPANSVLNKLISVVEKLEKVPSDGINSLNDLKHIVISSDISSFEVNFSGLVDSLLIYLTKLDDQFSDINRNQRIRNFIHIFANCPLNYDAPIDSHNEAAFKALINKLNCCIAQLEQFPVKVHDLPAGAGSTTALKFFNTHQLKCHLQRHPDSTNLKQWKGGTVKIDPLAMVQAIERYLVVRGYSRIRDKDITESEEDNSDEDIDDTLAAVISQGGGKHKLQFLIGTNVLPYNMTVYQAVKQFSPHVASEFGENDMESEIPIGATSIWVNTHTVHYRVAPDEPSSTNASNSKSSLHNTTTAIRKGKSGSSSKSASKKKCDDLWIEGTVPLAKSPLDPILISSLPPTTTLQDASLPVLTLLRILHGISRYWGSVYTAKNYDPLIPLQDFVNTKISAKANRQLQDPLVIMTGNLPGWLHQLAILSPFLLPFETRQLLFYATVFDRDRALQRLLDASPELANSSDSQERVAPRIDRRKKIVSRIDILKQAETVIAEVASSKSLLEIQYEDEVGTGLGPTLEFYTLVSKELQRADLELWINEDSSKTLEEKYVFSSTGLFVAPLGRTTKVSQLVKIKNKFRFLGKLMAKAVMDSRLLDLPLSIVFYKWMLGQEHTLSISDLADVVPDVYKLIVKLQKLVVEKKEIENNNSLSPEERSNKIDELKLDNCPIEDLGIDFTLPLHSQVELKKGGKNTTLNIYNIEKYCELVPHWFLVEGVARQMEAFREGFDSVFPISRLNMFYAEELERVFCGTQMTWDVKTMIESFKPDHGFTMDSKAIQMLLEILSSYNEAEQRDFLKFVTGSPRLPVGGFKSLSPSLTIVRKTVEENCGTPDEYLPSVMTCVNYLKLPDYSNIEIMRSKLRLAALEGQNSFHLS